MVSSRGRGITIRTVKKPIAGSAAPERSQRRSKRGRSDTYGDARKQAHPKLSRHSKRYREMLNGASRPGGSYALDDEVGHQLEESILEAYDPTPSATISTRALSLREMMRRDGCTSVWPSLKSLCEDVVAEQFSKKVLPLLSQNTAGEGQPSNSVGPGSPEARSRFGSSRATAKHSYGSLEMRLVHHKDDDSFIPARKEVRHESGYSAARARLLRESSNAGASLNSARMAKPIQQLKHEADTYARAETLEAQNEYLMTILPTNSAFRIKSILEKSQPTLLTFDVLQRLFLTKQRVALARRFTLIATDVESVSKNAREVALLLRGIMSEEVASLGPLHIIPQIVPPTQHLSALNLTAFVRLKSIQLHSLIAASPNLQDVTLRGCLSIDEETPMALMHHCRSLRRANFTWTSIGPVGFKYLLCAKELETLKVAHVRGLTDVAVRRAMEEATLAGKAAEPPFVPLNNLANLKLRSTEVSLHGLGVMLKHCGSKLVSLDVGGNFLGDANIQDFVELISPSQIQPNNNQRLRNATLTKLVMYPPTPYASKPELSLCDAIEVLIRNFTALRTLKIEGRSSDWCDPFQVFSSHATSEYKGHVDSLIVRDMSPSAQRRTTDDEVIREFDKLAFPVGQHSEEKKVGISLKCQKTDFTRAYCKLSGKTIDLSGRDLRNQQVESPVWKAGSLRCRHLILAGCKVPSNCHWPQLGADGSLRSANLAGSDVQQDDLDALIRLNPFLTSIDLNGCRAVPVMQRRNYLQLNFRRIHGLTQAG